jgi:tripartite-type tricarboxylate transporter receptor subunit TctC
MLSKFVAAGLLLCALCNWAHAQKFPNKPIRILVPTIAGSAPDVRVRQIGPKLSDAVGQPVIIDNRPGANGTIATQLAAKAVADGHTLFYGLINNVINDALHPDA